MQPWQAAGRSVRLHLHLAARLLGRPGFDCRRSDRRLLDRAPQEPESGRPLSHAGRLSLRRRLELAGGGGDTARLRFGLDRPGHILR